MRSAKRARPHQETTGEASGPSNSASGASVEQPPRPTQVERQEALTVIAELKDAGLLSGKATRVEPNIIACALALRRGEFVTSDRAAKRDFGLRDNSRVRQDWVDDGAKRLELWERWSGSNSDGSFAAFVKRAAGTAEGAAHSCSAPSTENAAASSDDETPPSKAAAFVSMHDEPPSIAGASLIDEALDEEIRCQDALREKEWIQKMEPSRRRQKFCDSFGEQDTDDFMRSVRRKEADMRQQLQQTWGLTCDWVAGSREQMLHDCMQEGDTTSFNPAYGSGLWYLDRCGTRKCFGQDPGGKEVYIGSICLLRHMTEREYIRARGGVPVACDLGSRPLLPEGRFHPGCLPRIERTQIHPDYIRPGSFTVPKFSNSPMFPAFMEDVVVGKPLPAAWIHDWRTWVQKEEQLAGLPPRELWADYAQIIQQQRQARERAFAAEVDRLTAEYRQERAARYEAYLESKRGMKLCDFCVKWVREEQGRLDLQPPDPDACPPGYRPLLWKWWCCNPNRPAKWYCDACWETWDAQQRVAAQP